MLLKANESAWHRRLAARQQVVCLAMKIIGAREVSGGLLVLGLLLVQESGKSDNIRVDVLLADRRRGLPIHAAGSHDSREIGVCKEEGADRSGKSREHSRRTGETKLIEL